MGLKFIAETHTYESIGDKKIDWVSVTRLIGLFKQPFNQKTMAEKCSVNKKSKWFGMKPEEILTVWKNETNRAVKLGSWYHDQREEDVLTCQTLHRNGIELPIINPIEQDGVKLSPEQILARLAGERVAFLVFEPPGFLVSRRVDVARLRRVAGPAVLGDAVHP